MFDSTGERGPPCGVPSSAGLTSPFSITPARKNARISFSNRLSLTRSAIFASNRSWLTRWWVGTGLATLSLVPVPPRRTRRADFPQRAPQVALDGGCDFSAIWSSCVNILFLPLSAGNVSPDQQLNLPRCFPLYAAFPRSEYYQRVRLPPSLLSPSGWPIRLTYSARYLQAEAAMDLPGAMTLPFLPIPCSQTPPEDRKSTRLNSSHLPTSYAVFCLTNR